MKHLLTLIFILPPPASNVPPSIRPTWQNENKAITLFNVEHEHLGIVRNLVGVGLGTACRAGAQPAASDALGFLVAVNDRVVCLIEELDRREQEQRQLEKTDAEHKRGLLSAAQETLRRTRGKGKKKKGSPFFRPVAARFSGNRSPPGSSRPGKTSPTRSRPPPPELLLPGSSPESSVKTNTPIGDDDARRGANKSLRLPRPTVEKYVRLHRLLEGGRPKDNGEATAAATTVATNGNNPATDENNPTTDENSPNTGENNPATGKNNPANDENSHGDSGDRASGGAGGRVGRVPSSPSSSPAPCLQGGASPRDFLWSAPVLLYSYAKLLNALVCGSYNLRAAFSSSCEADLRNIRRKGGYLDVLVGLDDGAPRKVFREAARFLHEILIECDCR